MCGIAGIYKYHSPDNISTELSVKKMLAMIRHRGPDETGIYLSGQVGLGSVRLSIVDLLSGQQPLSDESGNYWIVYNGEVFNHVELRELLEQKGVQLKTHCDTEVVVQMYALYGPKCLQYFNGQFAFCIWDKVRDELFLARDRVGIRPLFYWAEDSAFAFCSEIKGLFTLSGIKKAISPKSLAQVFTYWTTLSPNTPFENVYELPPGHYMVVNSSGIKMEKYWSMEFPVASEMTTGSLPDTIEALDSLLEDSVRMQLNADVQVGAYLSGGLDSSVTTAMINKVKPDILNTFSIGFKDKVFDETSYQQEASDYFKSNHLAFECTAEDIAEEFVNTVWHAEFPLLRTAPTPMFMLSKKVRESGIKVVITGEGADEFLAGYNIFKEAKIRRFWAQNPSSAIRPKLLSKLYPYLPMMKSTNNIALKMFFGFKLSDTENPLYSHLLRWHNTSRIKSFFSDEITNSLSGYEPLNDLYPEMPAGFMYWTDLAKSQYLEATIFMSGYLLSSQGDRMAMGNSVEGRYPFLDHRVIDFCNNMPDNFKMNCLNEKFVLKKLSEGKIPPSISKRPKQPYRAPVASSFLNASAPEYVKEMLSESCLEEYGLFNPAKVKALINKIQLQKTMPEVDQMAVAGILSTQLLHKMFILDELVADTDSLKNVRIIQESPAHYNAFA